MTEAIIMHRLLQIVDFPRSWASEVEAVEEIYFAVATLIMDRHAYIEKQTRFVRTKNPKIPSCVASISSLIPKNQFGTGDEWETMQGLMTEFHYYLWEE
jgi:hypothetical protein